MFKLNPDDYLLDRKILIGRGKFSDVYLVREASGSHVCLKQFHVFDEDDKKAFYRDSAVLASICGSEYVVEFHGFLTDDNERPAIITEYCRGGTLYSYLQQQNHLSKEEFMSLALCVANALNVIHRQRIVHGRLTLSKVLIYANHKYKVGGFETAVITKISPSVDIIDYGTLLYKALSNELELKEPLQLDTLEKKAKVIPFLPLFKDLIGKCISDENFSSKDLVAYVEKLLTIQFSKHFVVY